MDVADHVEDAEPPPPDELILHEIDRPAGIRHELSQQRGPRAIRLLPPTSAANRQSFFPVKTVGLLAVQHLALAPQQNMQTSVAETAPLPGQLPQALPQPCIARAERAVAYRRPVGPNHSARPPLAHLVALHQIRRGFSPGGGRHYFFVSRSLSTALSSFASASSRFSLAFSSSSASAALPRSPQAPGLCLPCIERRVADPVLATQIRGLRSCPEIVGCL